MQSHHSNRAVSWRALLAAASVWRNVCRQAGTVPTCRELRRRGSESHCISHANGADEMFSHISSHCPDLTVAATWNGSSRWIDDQAYAIIGNPCPGFSYSFNVPGKHGRAGLIYGVVAVVDFNLLDRRSSSHNNRKSARHITRLRKVATFNMLLYVPNPAYQDANDLERS